MRRGSCGRELASAGRQKLLGAEASASRDRRRHRSPRLGSGMDRATTPDPFVARELSPPPRADLPPTHVDDPIEPAEEVEPPRRRKSPDPPSENGCHSGVPCPLSHVTKSHAVAEAPILPACAPDPAGLPTPFTLEEHTHPGREFHASGARHTRRLRSAAMARTRCTVEVADGPSRSLPETGGCGLGRGAPAETQSPSRPRARSRGWRGRGDRRGTDPGEKERTASMQRLAELFR